MSGGSKSGSVTEHLFKILVIGDSGVGKTSFVNRYVKNHFSSHLKLTLGVDFSMKVIDWDSKTLVRLQLWDISGHEHFKNMSRAYFKGARGALVVYDVTKESTLEGALSWKLELDHKVVTDKGRPIPSVLLANKCDRSKVCSNEPCHIDRLCREKGFTGWFEVSATNLQSHRVAVKRSHSERDRELCMTSPCLCPVRHGGGPMWESRWLT
uniref:RAB32, member RAS onco family n=1 Tax=Astyanax mexicanus TaxID=7994 RepID=A0A3B1ICH1_ASTMX